MSNAGEIRIGAVLSDTDIREELKKYPNLITIDKRTIDFDEKEKDSLQPSCVDLHVGRIYIRGKEFFSPNDRAELPPGALVHIESMEKVTLPKHIMGFLVPKNSKSEAGLLFLNAGHVDPGWQDSFLTAEVMNVTAGKFIIAVGESLFSIVLQYLRSPATKPPRIETDDKRRSNARQSMEARPRTGYEFYLEGLRNEIAQNYATKEEARQELWNRRNLIIAIVTIVVSMIVTMLGAVAIAVTIAN